MKSILTALLFCFLFAPANAFAQDEEDVDAEDSVVIGHRGSSGAGFALGLGPYATYRRMTLEGSLRDIKHLPGIYIGGIIDLNLNLAKISDYGTLGAVVRGGFGSSKSTDEDATIKRQLVTENTFITVHLALDRPLTPKVDLRFIAGGGALSFTVEPNARYTGHRYITADFGVLGVVWFSDAANLSTGVIARPSLLTNQSDAADGAGRGFGLNGKLSFGYRVVQPQKGDLANAVEIVAGYDANYFHTSFPLSGRVGADPTSTDLSHTATLSLQYNL